ncbi:hypothetical protein [Macrococcus animalis]|uniref:hypothetical protein n=1 Tax=Macrococcus animalis TaxID=3395467 RepID=UPI0039BDC330
MIAKNLTRKKQIRNSLIGCLGILMSNFYINYFLHPEKLYDIDAYMPMFLGALIGTIVIYFTSKKKHPGNLNTKVTDERDEMISKEYNTLVFPIFFLYLPCIFMLSALPLKIESISFFQLSIVWWILLIIYAIGYNIFHKINS